MYMCHRPRKWACSQENESRSERRFGTWFGPFLIWKHDFTLCERNALSNQAFEREKKGVLDRDPRQKPDSRTLWTQSSFETWSVRVHFGNARWSHAWVNHRGLRSRSKILPRSAQIPIVIGKVFVMHVNARSSNHDPNHEADRDPKRLSERDSFFCEQAQTYMPQA